MVFKKKQLSEEWSDKKELQLFFKSNRSIDMGLSKTNKHDGSFPSK